MNYTMQHNWKQFDSVYRDDDIFCILRSRDDDLIAVYAEHLVDEMDQDELHEIAYDHIVDALYKYSNEQLLEEVKEFAPQLLEDGD